MLAEHGGGCLTLGGARRLPQGALGQRPRSVQAGVREALASTSILSAEQHLSPIDGLERQPAWDDSPEQEVPRLRAKGSFSVPPF
jgi:hypothetical protein